VFKSISLRLSKLVETGNFDILLGTQMGLEKESLRVSKSGGISQEPHPPAWGSALTHSWLTTDYSESLAEFITPPFVDAGHALDFLADMQAYAYRNLNKEILWATSMPCIIAGENSIPVAKYGESNQGLMKHIYRLGLGNRYGKMMQVIAGVHFNWSLPDNFWPMYIKILKSEKMPIENFRNEQYMGLIRNMLRTGWIIPYLFGASPAVCKSFFGKEDVPLPKFDEFTYFEPFATSLRMGDIGYQNSKEAGLGINACYDNIEAYSDFLIKAISTPTETWGKIGIKVDGKYRQLNANILQIENEYYSSVRPKQELNGLESPAIALKKRGVKYIELRSLDVNAYHPLGVDELQLRFLENWMLACLLADSPLLTSEEQSSLNTNLLKVAHRGREPNLRLQKNGKDVSLKEWGQRILDSMLPLAGALDLLYGRNDYEDALDEQFNKILQPDLTPSARMLHEMRNNDESFYDFSSRLSNQHHIFFNQRDMSDEQRVKFDKLVYKSFRDQEIIESRPKENFDKFLENYFLSIKEA
tara:strand:+ start:22363 stop:23949 length:1587 start_codon:yes stop_codon:yes gene_type:complete